MAPIFFISKQARSNFTREAGVLNSSGKILGVHTKRRKSAIVVKFEYLNNVKCYTKYGLLHFHRKLAMSTTI